MKKIAVALLILCCIFINTVASASMILEYDGSVHNYTGAVYALEVNGQRLQNLPLEPIIFNDRALVPVREVFEALGASVTYNSTDQSIKIGYSGKSVNLQIGSSKATVNGTEKTIPDNACPRLIAKWGESAKTMVPVRFISESVGLTVNFDSGSGCISISDGKTPSKPTAAPTAVPSSAVKLNKVSYSEDGGVVTITVSANGAISSISNAAVTASGVLYTDVSNASYTVPNKTDINTGAAVAVRMGIHGNNTRIAVDTDGMKKYSISLSSDRKSVVLQISSDENAVIATPAPSSPAPTNNPSPNKTKIVVLDAGHGGSDPGASGSLMTDSELDAYYAALESTEPILATMPAGSGTKYYEKNIALSVTSKVKSILESKGVSVIMTRTGDTYPTLDERPELANSSGAALFLSIHLNSTATEVTAAKGIEVYYSENNNDIGYVINSQQTAEIILKDVIAATGAKSRGVKSANHLVTRKSQMPANLIEIGFMNNPTELKNLADESYQNKLALGIANGITDALAKIVLP